MKKANKKQNKRNVSIRFDQDSLATAIRYKLDIPALCRASLNEEIASRKYWEQEREFDLCAACGKRLKRKSKTV